MSDRSDTGTHPPDPSEISIPHSVDPNAPGNGPCAKVYLDGEHVANVYDEELMDAFQAHGYDVEVLG